MQKDLLYLPKNRLGIVLQSEPKLRRLRGTLRFIPPLWFSLLHNSASNSQLEKGMFRIMSFPIDTISSTNSSRVSFDTDGFAITGRRIISSPILD